jgi:ABC-type methionine transport system permease subunit
MQGMHMDRMDPEAGTHITQIGLPMAAVTLARVASMVTTLVVSTPEEADQGMAEAAHAAGRHAICCWMCFKKAQSTAI